MRLFDSGLPVRLFYTGSPGRTIFSARSDATPTGYAGDPIDEADLVAALRLIATGPATPPTEVTGFELDGKVLPPFHYCIVDGPATIGSGWDWTDYFTDDEDTHFAVTIFRGKLTVESGEVFTPPVRKLGWFAYALEAEIDGEVSMSQRGANHSASGSDLVAVDLRIFTGTLGAVVNPQIPAAGGAGAAVNGAVPRGEDGSAGTGGGTGGGGAGASTNASNRGGSGSSGSAYSGGTAGGGSQSTVGDNADDGDSRGGAGGAAVVELSSNRAAGGGAGNPGGAAAFFGAGVAQAGGDGTGGALVVVCDGVLSGDGAGVSDGAPGGDANNSGNRPGGASGGGSVTVIAQSGTITTTANGGVGGDGPGDIVQGGNGGIGDARVLTGSF
jgi:hypothetical protein